MTHTVKQSDVYEQTSSWTIAKLMAYGLSMNLKLTKVFQKVPEGFIGFVEELPGANTQGETLDEVRANLEEAIELAGCQSYPG